MRARCVRKVAHPAPEIELESCDANADRVAGIGDRTHFGNANRRTWRAAASHIAVGAERRQPFGTLDSIKTTGSEEHTSELQSLMRISYAVFCLKQKRTKTKT